MALIDTENLLQPISEAEPVGSNLEYDPAFAALERAAMGKAEQQIGESVVAGEPPDWRAVNQQAIALLGRSKDLRVVGHLVRALLYRDGIQGLFEGLAMLRQMLERYWVPLHPQLDPEDNNDPTIRLTALGFLSGSAVAASLRVAPLVQSRSFGAVSLRDIAVATGEIAPQGDAPKMEMSSIEAAFQECDVEALSATAGAVTGALSEVRAIDSLFTDTIRVAGPDLAGLVRLLRQADQFIAPRLASRLGISNGEVAGGEHPNGAGSSTRIGAPGELASREDVVRTLDKICAYYARHEPSSPLPILLERCKRLATMSFLEIVREMVPEGMPHLEIIAGKREET